MAELSDTRRRRVLMTNAIDHRSPGAKVRHGRGMQLRLGAAPVGGIAPRPPAAAGPVRAARRDGKLRDCPGPRSATGPGRALRGRAVGQRSPETGKRHPSKSIDRRSHRPPRPQLRPDQARPPQEGARESRVNPSRTGSTNFRAVVPGQIVR